MKNYLIFCLTALLIVAVSCQQDDFFSDQKDNDLLLKSYTQIEDFNRWELTIPSILGESKGLLTLPKNWNELPDRYLIFYAHGMVDPDEPLALPNDSVGGKPVEKIVLDMNMGYATTSYGDNGLVADRAVEDIVQLVAEVNTIFDNNNELLPPDYLFLGGPSEGGLVTVLTIERYPHIFDGALSICGPIGNFYNQLQYNGDFHVLFNYFFEKELQDVYHNYLGNPQDGVGDSTINRWNEGNEPLELQWLIRDLMDKSPAKVEQLLRCAKVTVDMNDFEAMKTAVMECLRFNVKLTNDVVSRLSGVPFNNTHKWYWGSYNDWLLNQNVQRVLTSDYPIARENVKEFETTGNIEIPLVTIHTTGDHVTPYWHQTFYRFKIWRNRNSYLYTGIPVFNYGHCTIEESQLIAGMAIMITKASLINQFIVNRSIFSSNKSMDNFKQIMEDNSVDFEINE